MNDKKTFCGFISIIGRPNVGKSTLLNHLLGEKICITSRKPQTTRDRIMGVKTFSDQQLIFIDTPGIHANAKKALNQTLNKTARQSLSDTDIILFVLEANRWTEEEDRIATLLKKQKAPIVIAINKIDLVKEKRVLNQFILTCQSHLPEATLMPISAKQHHRLDHLEAHLLAAIPESPFHFYPEQKTDRPKTFQIAELIREQVFRQTGQELPYSTAVKIDKLDNKNDITHIYATIWVERDGQKSILIGRQGSKLKSIGQLSREAIEKMLNQKVYLNLWIKIKENWSENKRLLNELGLIE